MKRYIYLISPQKIKEDKFYHKLKQVLKTNKVKYFQLRLKKTSFKNLLKISRKIKKIVRKNNVKFLINDKPLVAKMINADGGNFQKYVDMSKNKEYIRGITKLEKSDSGLFPSEFIDLTVNVYSVPLIKFLINVK